MNPISRAALFMAGLLLTACSHHPATLPLPLPYQHWLEAEKLPQRSNQYQPQQWWQGDERLKQLIANATLNAPQVKLALARLEEVQALKKQVEATQWPDFSGMASASRGRQNAIGGNRNAGIFNNVELGVNASWELDLWGFDPAHRAAAALLQNQQALYDDALLSLKIQLTTHYVAWLEATERLKMQQEAVQEQQKILALYQDLEQAGQIRPDETIAIEQSLYDLVMGLPPLNNLQKSAFHAMRALSGMEAGQLTALLKADVRPTKKADDNDKSLQQLQENSVLSPPDPEKVMLQRPDVRAASHQLIYALARQEVSEAEKYPLINLTALLALGSGQAGQLLQAGSLLWNGKGLVSFPLLDFGRIDAKIDEQKAKVTQAKALYEQVMATTLQEVETALAEGQQATNLYQQSQKKLQQALKTAEYSHGRYLAGLESKPNLQLAKLAVLLQKQQLLHSQAEIIRANIKLITAIGG
ncbi:MAG: TolC family protein [Alphaproteobacteria bacterium]